MLKASICCGTIEPIAINIVLDEYCERGNTAATDEEINKALELLEETMCGSTFTNDGYRNDDAVNSSIALYVLGYDPLDWFCSFFALENYTRLEFFDSDVEKFMEHLDRVHPYLEDWGPKGDEGRALRFSLP